MRRREFIATTAAAIGNSVCGSSSLIVAQNPAAVENPLPLNIIDCHTHFYDPTRPQGLPWPDPNSELYRVVLPQHLRELKTYRPVSGTVVVEASIWPEDNQWLLDLAKRDPFIKGIVGNLQPGTAEFTGYLQRFQKQPLFRGIRIRNDLLDRLIEQKKLDDLKRLAAADLSLDVNGGPTTPASIATAAPLLPELRFVLNHLGNVMITGQEPPPEWIQGIQAAASHPNVYAKISGLVEGASRNGKTASTELNFYRPCLNVMWEAFGADRLIYGSNWPVSDRGADYFTLQKIAIDFFQEKGQTALHKFCHANATRAYKWVPRDR